jgi:hypothetical protein
VTVAYPVERVREEAAYIAYHFHWPLGEIMDLPHPERIAWVGQVSRINEQILNQEDQDPEG